MTNIIIHQEFESSKLELIKKTIAKDATETELELFLYQCKRTGLDPLAKQIYFQKRKNQVTGQFQMIIITAIDGYRLIADRTGLYAGSDDAKFEGAGDELTATVTVYKMVQNQRCPFSASARWQEYFPGEKLGFMWRKMPKQMLSKCAEALALRKAFPADLSGLYVKEEMDQAGSSEEKGRIVKDAIETVAISKGEDRPVSKFIITIGKYSGQTLEEVGPEKIQRFISYFEEKELKEQKPIEGKLKEVLENGRAYLAELETKEAFEKEAIG